MNNHCVWPRSLFVVFLLAAASASSTCAVTIQMNSQTSGNPLCDPEGTRLTAIMQSVKAYWEDIIEDPWTLTVNFSWSNLDSYSPKVLAVHQPINNSYYNGKRREITCNISFDTYTLDAETGQYLYNWFIDSTPTISSEYDFEQWRYGELSPAEQSASFSGSPPSLLETGYRGTANSSAPDEARTGFDLFTVALHEVGHALGLTSGVAYGEVASDDDYDVNVNLTHGSPTAIKTYDQSDIYHVNDVNALMYPYSKRGKRTLPSATDVLAMAAASNWTALDLPRKDFWGGASWNTAYNWEGNRLPDSGDDVFVRHGGIVTLGDTGNAGKLRIDDASGVDTGAHSLRVSDTTQIDHGSRLIVGTHGSLNTGHLALLNQSSLVLAGGTVQGNLPDQSTMSISADSSMTGHGTLNLDVVNDGSISTGDSAGLMTINGNFTQNASGILRMKLGGIDAGVNSDLLAISGQADLSGLLDISLADMFTPSQGDIFRILTYGSYAGQFDAMSHWIIGDGLYFEAEYDATAMDLVTRHAIPGDANYDGSVNKDDLAIMAGWYGKTGTPARWETTDFNGDGLVNWDDLTLLATNYTNPDGTLGIDPALLAPMVPEPTVLILMALGASITPRQKKNNLL